jgi:hypothetical protein
MSASPWNIFEDGYVISGIGLLLCKCQKICYAMIHFPDNCGVSSDVERKFKGMYYLYEKLGLGSFVD